jgi:hypothetical protein
MNINFEEADFSFNIKENILNQIKEFENHLKQGVIQPFIIKIIMIQILQLHLYNQ